MAEIPEFYEAPDYRISFHPYTMVRESRMEGYDTGWRRLPAMLVEIPEGGPWQLWLEGRDDPLIAEDKCVMVIPAGTRHRLVCKPEDVAITRVFMGEFRGVLHNDLLIDSDIPPVLEADVGRRLIPLIDDIVGVWAVSKPTATDMILFHNKAYEIMSIIMEYAGRKELIYHDYDLKRITRVVSIIRSDPAANHSCTELASSCGLSPSRFNAVFKKVMGVAPKVYLRDLRLGQACSLLLSTDLPVYRIAKETGFQTSAYFCRFFARHIGMAPAMFRGEFNTRKS